MSTMIEKQPATMSTLSMKSYSVFQNFAQNPSATGLLATLCPKCALLSGMSPPVRPLESLTLIFSQTPFVPSTVRGDLAYLGIGLGAS